MKKEINLLELFSGIGGFTVGLQNAGFKIKNHYFSEVDKHAIANYKYNFKNGEHIGSVTDVRGTRGQADIITFGSPCQDFSLAGKRKGMEGERSSLIIEAIRLISEIRPSVFIWENVKGTFSSNNGADFWAILAAFANIGGYRLEWQLLNTKWVLPQNRERIYLVGHLAGRSTGNVFPFTENDRLFDVEKTTGKGRTQTEYSTTLKATGTMKADDTFISVPKISGCLTGGGHSGGLHSDMTVIPVLTPERKEIRQNDTSSYVKIAKPSRTDEAKKIRKESLKKGKDYTPFQGKKVDFVDSDVMNAITCATQKDNLIKVPSNTKKGFDIMTEEDSLNLSVPSSKTRRGRVGKGIAQTLDTACNQGVIQINTSKESGGKQPFQQNRVYSDKGLMTALDTDSGRKSVYNNAQIRRLTEIECERLQGYPDDWTKFGVYEKQVWINKKEGTFEIVEGIKEIPKSQRYKLCGNAVTSDIVEMIAERLNIKN